MFCLPKTAWPPTCQVSLLQKVSLKPKGNIYFRIVKKGGINMGSTSFILENFAILVPVIYIIGMFLKVNSKVPNWIIPWILLLCGIGFSIWMVGFGVESIIQGILVSGSAVFGNQLFKQTMEGLYGDKPKQ